MGCGGSKPEAPDPVPTGSVDSKALLTATPDKPSSAAGGEATSPVNKDGRRPSVVHKAPEFSTFSPGATETPFNPAVIGTLTRHGIAPARRGLGITSQAKINQDRGVVCWPFNGTHDQALLCVFDGHGMQGDKVAAGRERTRGCAR